MGSIWWKSRTIEFDMGFPAAGAQAFFFLGNVQGTPITVFADAAETSAHPNPVVADGNGRWPAVFIPYMDSYGVRVQSEANVPLWLDPSIPNPNPVDVSVTIPADQQLQTGMVHWEPIQGVKAAFVRCNGRTVGNASSSGTERKNLDTRNLFIYLYGAMPNNQAPVFLPSGAAGTRTGNAGADYDTGNMAIQLPDLRGAGPYGLDDMGAASSGLYNSPAVGWFSSGGPTIPGSRTGNNFGSFSLASMPAHSHGGTTGDGGVHSHGGATGNETGAGHKHNILATAVSTSTAGDHSHITSDAGTHVHTAVTAAETQDHTHPQTSFLNLLTPTQGGGAGVPNTWVGVSTSTINTGGRSATHTHAVIMDGGGAGGTHVHSTNITGGHAHTVSGVTESPVSNHTHAIPEQAAHTHPFTTDTQGQSAAINNLGRIMIGTWYIKL